MLQLNVNILLLYGFGTSGTSMLRYGAHTSTMGGGKVRGDTGLLASKGPIRVSTILHMRRAAHE